jgi:hypothetical protein
MQMEPSTAQVLEPGTTWQMKPLYVPTVALARGSGGPAGGVVLLVAGQVCGGVAAPLVGEFTYVDDSGESCDCKHGVSGMQQAQQVGGRRCNSVREGKYVSKTPQAYTQQKPFSAAEEQA